jgi:uncharacterized membrane protein
MNKKNNIRSWAIGISVLLVSLIVLALIIGFFSSLGYLESFRIVFGSVYVLFVPGFLISYIFFPITKELDEQENKDKNEGGKAIDWIERIALSFALSIAIVPLAVFYLNLVGVKINIINTSLIILGIIIVSLVGVYLRFKKLKNKNY